MFNSTLEIIIKAKDEASTVVSGLNDKLKTMEPAFKKMAAVGTVAFTAIAAVAVTSFKAFSDAQAQTEITNKSLQNTLAQLDKGALASLNKSLGGTKDIFGDLKKSAEEAGKAAVKMGFDDETAASSFAKLFAVTKSVTQANKELALAQDLARYKGISLEEATQKLMMVHAGATKELKALGIAVKDGATAMENLDSIQKQVGGSANTFANTAAGAMERIKVQTDNLKESIGGALAPVFEKLLTKVTPLLEKFADWAEKNPDLLAKIILLAGGIAGLVAVVGTLGLVLPSIIAGFTLLAGPVGLVILAIAGIGFAIYKIIEIFNILKNDGDMIWLGIQTMINEKIEAIKTTITTVINGIKTVWITVWTAISTFFTNIWSTMRNTAQSAIDSIKNFLQPIIDMVDRVINKLAQIGKSVGNTISGAVKSVGNTLGINDGIVQNGQIITTHPDDYIIATKTPETLGGKGNGGIVVNIMGGNYLSQDAALEMGDYIIKALQTQMRGAR